MHARHTIDVFRPVRDAPAQRYYRTSAPEASPISLADAKAHLRVDFDDDDTLIQRMVNTAIARLDGNGKERNGLLGRALITQTWVLEAERPQHGRIPIEYGDVQSITSVEVMNAGSYAAWPGTNYRLGFRDQVAFVTPVSGQSFPSHDHREDAFRITYVCGYGDAAIDLPPDIIEALLLHVGHLYENREAVIAGTFNTLPLGYMDHIELHRVHHMI